MPPNGMARDSSGASDGALWNMEKARAMTLSALDHRL